MTRPRTGRSSKQAVCENFFDHCLVSETFGPLCPVAALANRSLATLRPATTELPGRWQSGTRSHRSSSKFLEHTRTRWKCAGQNYELHVHRKDAMSMDGKGISCDTKSGSVATPKYRWIWISCDTKSGSLATQTF